MKSFLLALTAVFLPLFLSAQNLSLSTDAQLFERPDSSSTVKMTLPTGMQLQILTEQGDWMAVSTTTGLVGWVHKAPISDEPSDLIRSMQEMNEQQANQPPPATSTTPPPPPPSTGAATGAGAGAAAAGAAGAVTTPPPPPARPPGQGSGSGSGSGANSFGAPPPSQPPLTSIIAGLYDKYQWVSAGIELKENFKRLDLQYNKIVGKITQFGGWFTGTDGFLIPNFDPEDFGDLGDFFEQQSEAVAKFAKGETCACADVKTYEGGLRLNFYPMSGSSSPAGIYFGGLAGFGVFGGEDKPEGVDGIGTLGGEVGIFYKIGSSNSPQFVPQAQIQFTRKQYLCSEETFFCGFDSETGEAETTIGDTGTTARFGLEMNYHGLVPGVHLTLVESVDPDKSFDSIFGFSFTFAY